MPAEEVESLKADMALLKESLHRIEKAIVGDLDMGHKGIAKRLYDVERKAHEHSMRFYVWGGITTGAALIISHFKSKLFP